MAKAPARPRAPAKIKARRLTDEDAAIIRAMIERGVAQHDIASFMGCHPTLVSAINRGHRFSDIAPADLTDAAVMRRLIEGLAGWNARVSRVIHEAVTTAAPVAGRVI